MNHIIGTWDVKLKTPIGTIATVYTFTLHESGVNGVAVAGADESALTDIHVEESESGERVTWRQRVTKPMRLNLEFDVMVSGDELAGWSRAGRLPRTDVSGRRRTQ